MKYKFFLLLAVILARASIAAPHHFGQCELFIMGVSMKGKIFSSGETFELTSLPIESLEENEIDFSASVLPINSDLYTVQEFKNNVGSLIHSGLFMGNPNTMNDGLTRYLSYRNIAYDTPFILDVEEVKLQSQSIAQEMDEALFDAIYNAPENCKLELYLYSQGFNPAELHSYTPTFSLNTCPINTSGDEVTELTFFTSLSVKGCQFFDSSYSEETDL